MKQYTLFFTENFKKIIEKKFLNSPIWGKATKLLRYLNLRHPKLNEINHLIFENPMRKQVNLTLLT